MHPRRLLGHFAPNLKTLVFDAVALSDEACAAFDRVDTLRLNKHTFEDLGMVLLHFLQLASFDFHVRSSCTTADQRSPSLRPFRDAPGRRRCPENLEEFFQALAIPRVSILLSRGWGTAISPLFAHLTSPLDLRICEGLSIHVSSRANNSERHVRAATDDDFVEFGQTLRALASRITCICWKWSTYYSSLQKLSHVSLSFTAATTFVVELEETGRRELDAIDANHRIDIGFSLPSIHALVLRDNAHRRMSLTAAQVRGIACRLRIWENRGVISICLQDVDIKPAKDIELFRGMFLSVEMHRTAC